MKCYDLSGFTLYLFAAVVGSVVCTNALRFEAEQVRARLVHGDAKHYGSEMSGSDRRHSIESLGTGGPRYAVHMAQLGEPMMMADVVERLTRRHDDLPPDEVATAVHHACTHFDQSPIRKFVPLLVERRARK